MSDCNHEWDEPTYTDGPIYCKHCDGEQVALMRVARIQELEEQLKEYEEAVKLYHGDATGMHLALIKLVRDSLTSELTKEEEEERIAIDHTTDYGIWPTDAGPGYKVQNFRLGSFATGNYGCHCAICGGEFLGDKRASSCLPCMIKAADDLAKQLKELKAENKRLNSLVGYT